MMARVLYTAEAQVTGGRTDGHGRTSDGALEVDLRAPQELGGEGGGTNPEQLFAVGFASCFSSALSTIARRRHEDIGEVSIDSKVTLGPGDDRSFEIGVTLDVKLPKVSDPAQAAELVAAAHKVCPYSNATRGNIEVSLSANGEPVAEARQPVGERGD
jgi:osmotically inducible protein OsmC